MRLRDLRGGPGKRQTESSEGGERIQSHSRRRERCFFPKGKKTANTNKCYREAQRLKAGNRPWDLVIKSSLSVLKWEVSVERRGEADVRPLERMGRDMKRWNSSGKGLKETLPKMRITVPFWVWGREGDESRYPHIQFYHRRKTWIADNLGIINRLVLVEGAPRTTQAVQSRKTKPRASFLISGCIHPAPSVGLDSSHMSF